MNKPKVPIIVCILLCTFSFFQSCDRDEEWKSTIHELKIATLTKTAMVGKDFEVTDLSLGVAQRKWTFEKGTPLNSSDPVVKVVFDEKGPKKCRLELTYDNGTTEQHEFTIDVLENLAAVLTIEGLTPMGAIPLGKDIKFSLQSIGNPTKFKWKFPGGSPEESTAENPIVKWSKKGKAKIQLELLREIDSATFIVEREIVVGNYPQLLPYTKADMDSWSFDAGSKIGKWTAWSEQGRDEVSLGKLVRASGGADQTAYSMRINYNKANESWSLFTRDNWTNNAHLQKGKKYEFIFWMKADANFTLSEVMLLNNLPDWSWNELLQAHAKNNWSQYYPNIPFEVQNETRIFHRADLGITTNWQEFRFEFVVGDVDIQNNPLPQTLLNTFPSFVINSAAPSTIYLDEVQINLIED